MAAVSRQTRPDKGWFAPWLWAVPVLLLAAWLGARGLNRDALWYDEWLSVYYAGGAQYGPIAPAEIWTRVAERSTWPPGFQTLLAGWGLAVGWSHTAARALPLLAGLLAVAWLYRLGRDLVSHRAGLAAAVFLGASAFFAHYLHELRGYTLYALFATLCVWSYWRIVYRRHSPWTQAAFFFSVLGLLYTHYFAALTAVGVALYHLLMAPKTRTWWRVPALMAGAGLLFVPWLALAFSSLETDLERETRGVVPLTTPQIFETVLFSFANGSLALIALIGVYAVRDGRRYRRVFILLVLWLVCTLAIPVLLNERLGVIFHIRHFMAVWPAMALLAALGVAALSRSGVPAPLILTIWVAAGLWAALDPAFIEEQPGAERALNWASLSTVLDEVKRHGQPEDVLLYHVEEPGREWLTEGVIDVYSEPLGPEHTQLEEIPGLPENDEYFHALQDFIDDAPFVWLVTKPGVPSPYHLREFNRAMLEGYAHCGQVVNAAELTLDLYARVPDNASEQALRFGDQFGLRMLNALPASVESRLDVLLGWTMRGDIPIDAFSYALHVTDSSGELVAQHDAGLPSGPVACTAARLDLSALPPGSYTLHVVVYEWQSGERLMGETAEGVEGDRLPLVAFRLS